MLSLQRQVSTTDSDREIQLRACSEDFNGGSKDHAMATEWQHSVFDELGDVPQALLELSFRDLVELPQIIGSAMQEKQIKEREYFTERKSRSWEGRKKATKKRRPRSQSMDIGLGLLKWIVPLSSSGRKERFVFVSPSSLTSGASINGAKENREDESTRNASANSSCSISKKLTGCFFLDSRKQN